MGRIYNTAATTIQSFGRTVIARNDFEKHRGAAVTIQRGVRAIMLKTEYIRLTEERQKHTAIATMVAVVLAIFWYMCHLADIDPLTEWVDIPAIFGFEGEDDVPVKTNPLRQMLSGPFHEFS